MLETRFAQCFEEIAFDDPSLTLADMERWAFHGTYTRNLDSIFSKNFDERLCKRGSYGMGIYFTTDFKYAAKFSSCENHNQRDCSGLG